ncbi:hypothetical protein SAMN05660297_03211 [Natronincola peptidivorans]|uniref:Uncharacterized protein n=1 Tax=Natronincola peptidivorans TaxID=426128 RepID=A0A1I0GH18_9FIRM|nr:hypothetical protein [Natronincola peptidivorans]SET70425.1 hypothetical protein SAMN05660297_03211 [Natronincola peptidivorans]
MKKESDASINYSKLGKAMIETALLVDENLASLLKVEAQKIRKLLKSDVSLEELETTNTLIKNIIMAMMLTDEKMRYGLELCKINKEK